MKTIERCLTLAAALSFSLLIALSLAACDREPRHGSPVPPHATGISGQFVEISERLYGYRVDDTERGVTCWVFRDPMKEGLGTACLQVKDAGTAK